MKRIQPRVSDWVQEHARRWPARPSISGEGLDWTYRDLWHATLGASKVLRKYGRRNGPVGIVMVSAPQAVAALLACESSGRPAVLLPGSAQADELESLMVQSPAAVAMIPRAAARHWPGTLVETDHPHLLLGAAGARPPVVELPHGIVQLTSGSLGASKFAVRAWTGVYREIAAVTGRLGLTHQDRMLCASSIAHSYGLIGSLLSSLVAGCPVSLAGQDISGCLERFRPTVVFGLARSYELLLDRPEPGRSLQDVRLTLSAGAPLPAGLFNRVQEETGLQIRQDYGTTETGTISIDDENPAHPGTVGTALPHVEVQIASRPDRMVPAPATGEIQVRSPAVAVGYVNDGTLTPCTDSAGWYHTQDSGWLDVAGRLGVGGRLRSPIPVGPALVQPDIVEQSIAALPGIREAVVVPIALATGTAIKAVVATDLDSSTVQEWCGRSLPLEYRPALIEVRDALPRSPAGKILQKYVL